ncbi:translocation protein Sec72p [[Candida] railenensis]|uniref:Translocation protein Sec72p n=1 Tax=[Candida] railenensis TaxID=45579 RepID=A0A9P0QKU4_9ASCO|nr:translocation protein Sec72p [[Candida] railenensis]
MNVPLAYDAKTKQLSLPKEAERVVPLVKLEVDQLNTLVQELIANGSDVPPPPTPENFNKDMSKMIKKLYEGGVQAFKQGKYEESAKQFNIGVAMIARRTKFESFQGTLQELGLFLMSRADAYLKTKNYLGAFNDADMLIGMMMVTPDNFLRRGVANYLLGNYEDARADYQRGLSFDPDNQRLTTELEIVLDKILEENGDYL